MVRKIKLALILITIFLLNPFIDNGFCDEQNYDKKINSLTIFSEDNISYPLIRIAHLYAKSTNSVVSTNFDNSLELIKNIEDGEPADIFISSHPDWLENLKQKGLVDIYNVSNIATDRLVLVISKNNKRVNKNKINKLEEMAKIFKEINKQNLLIISDYRDASTQKYIKSFLKDEKINQSILNYKDIGEKKSMVNFISENDEYCGIILESEAKNYDKIEILKTIESNQIHYQALVITGNNMNQARDFLKFITSGEAKDVFAENNFITD